MSKVTRESAKSLRAIAESLEKAEAAIKPRASEVMRDFAPQMLCVDMAMQPEYAGHVGFDARRYLTSACGNKLAHYIADKLDFELLRDGGFTARNPYFEPLRYRATVYAFTPEELRVYTERVLEAGRGLA